MSVFNEVQEIIANKLSIDAAEVKPESSFIDDLGADSLDLLDLIFQLEQHFGLRIKTRDLERRAQAELGDTPLEVDGVYTAPALESLRRALPEVPAEELGPGLRTAELPYRFRVATFVRLIERLREEQARG